MKDNYVRVLAQPELMPYSTQEIEFKYFESMVWKDILKTTKAFVEERQAKQQRRVAIEKMLPLLRITTEQFEFCIRKVKKDVID